MRASNQANRQHWHQRQLTALTRFHTDRRVWDQALAALAQQSA